MSFPSDSCGAFNVWRRKPVSRLSTFIFWLLVSSFFVPFAGCAESELKNDVLVVRTNSADGSYVIATVEGTSPVVRSGVAAELDHHWLRSSDYPQHAIAGSSFTDPLGHGQQLTVRSIGLADRPDLSYVIRLYDGRAFGAMQVLVENRCARAFDLQAIRSLEATGDAALNLHAPAGADRVLSDSFSEDWPPLRIYDLGKAPNGMHRAVGSQLVYNQQSKESAFFGALTADRLLTLFHLKTQPGSAGPTITSFTIDSTGTTEIQATEEESALREGPRENLIELSLPLASGETIASERLMFAAGSDYHSQLENYGAAIRELHHSRIADTNLLGWWSWTAFYMDITEGKAFTNALWLAEHLKSLGYNYFHFDFGYGYARGDYAIPNASKFPHGMRLLSEGIRQLGLKIGLWTAPFEVGERSSIYQHHKDWLVHNASGAPIPVTTDEEVRTERVFALDTTNPAAQEFLRQTYHTLVREWGVEYIKLDFMDVTAIEGYYARPHTTALEALRIGLEVIRQAVGDGVLLDKDGSPMLTPVGLVDEGRTSQDTGHTFLRSKEAAPGIAARYYMQRNFFIDDPDAFTVSRQRIEEREIHDPLTRNEAEVSIALAVVSGGMYEIGDDLPTLGADPDRVMLVENPDLLAVAKLGRAAVPLDLLSYRAEDEQPSVFLLHEDARQSILAVFNWTDESRSHRFSLSELKLPGHHPYAFQDILEPGQSLLPQGDSLQVEQPARSVKLIKIVDTSRAAAAPSITVQVPSQARVGEELEFSCRADADRVPPLAYHWDFGDGTTEDARTVKHTYTKAGNYTVRLVVDGIGGIAAERRTSVSVSGTLTIPPASRYDGE